MMGLETSFGRQPERIALMSPHRFGPFLAVLILASAAGAAGCTGDTQVTNVPPDTSGITVAGHGEVQAPPDTGFFDIGVEVTATTVEDARSRAARAADAVISAVKKNGVDDKDIRTLNISIFPAYDYGTAGQPRITGYVVSNTVEVKVRKLDTFSAVIDAAIAAGGDAARLHGVRFDIEDTDKLRQQARELAMKDARARAEELAKLGEVDLGDPIAITETFGTNPTPVLSVERAAGAADLATPIQPGTATVVVEVSVRWAINP